MDLIKVARCSRGRLVAFVHESFVIEVHFSCSVSVVSIPLILSAWSSVPRYVCRVLVFVCADRVILVALTNTNEHALRISVSVVSIPLILTA